MSWKLSKAASRLREQIDDAFPGRDRTSDGSIGDARHAARPSDHNPSPEGWVRAIDIDADLRSHKSEAFDLADQLRLLARSDKRLAYIIFNGKIASYRRNFKWRKYTGINPHKHHIHISFTKQGDNDDKMFRIPILTGEPINGASKSNRSKLGKIISRSRSGNLPSGGLAAGGCPQCGFSGSSSRDSSLAQS